MQDYVFVTDDCCDLPPQYYRENGIVVKYLGYSIDGATHTSRETTPQEFYEKMRAGHMPTTTQVGVDDWIRLFEPFLQAGRDILYLAFSSGLSGTYGSAMVAADDLREKYPDRTIAVVDSLCASLGQGLLLHKANKLRMEGMALPELAAWIEERKLHVSHVVAVDDLMHLHRGGRVSRTSAVAGSLLGIKPMIHMNGEGKLIPIDKVRGRKKSLEAIVDMTEKRIGGWDNDIFMVCHSDCLEDANYVAELASKRFGIQESIIHYIGPVIGTHTGPGTVALFVMADHR